MCQLFPSGGTVHDPWEFKFALSTESGAHGFKERFVSLGQVEDVRCYTWSLFQNAMGADNVNDRVITTLLGQAGFGIDALDHVWESWGSDVVTVFKTVRDKWFVLHPHEDSVLFTRPHSFLNKKRACK